MNTMQSGSKTGHPTWNRLHSQSGTWFLGMLMLALAACSSPPATIHADSATSTPANATQKQPAQCTPAQLALRLNDRDGRFDGMSHSGTQLVLRNTGTGACMISRQPLLTFLDADRQTLDIAAQDSTHPARTLSPFSLPAGATVTSDIRWVSGDVYDHGHCQSPAHLALKVGQQSVTTAFTGRLCGAGGKPSTYTSTPFATAEGSASDAASNVIAYTCDDGRSVRANYADNDTAVLTIDGATHHLHIVRSASGARYVDRHWQWWTKGMHDVQLDRKSVV